MIDTQLQSQRLQKKLQILLDLNSDYRWLFDDTLDYWKNFVVKDIWSTQGQVLGKRWDSLNPLYSNNTAFANSGTLRDAVSGKNGYWFQKVEPQAMRFGIQDLPYSRLQHFGHVQQVTNKQRGFFWFRYSQTKNDIWRVMALSKQLTYKPRAYMLTSSGEVSPRLLGYMVRELNRELDNEALEKKIPLPQGVE